MKRTIFLTLTILTLLCASCLREEDRELFRHDFVAEGSFDPNLGLPIAQGTMNLQDVMNMLPEDSRALLSVDEQGIVTIVYQSDYNETFETSKKAHATAKGAGDPVYHWDTTFTYRQELGIFDEENGLPSAEQFGLEQLMVSFLSSFKAHAVNQDMFEHYGAMLALDNIRVQYVDRNGNSQRVVTDIDNEHYPLTDLLGGDTLSILSSYDASSIINARPKEVSVSVRLNIDLTAEMFRFDMSESYFQDIIDSLQVSAVDVGAHLDVHYPLNFYLLEYPFLFDMALSDTLGKFNLDSLTDEHVSWNLDTLRLVMRFDNGIPFGLKLNAAFYDEHDVELFSIMQQDTILNSAPIKYDSQTQLHISNGYTPSKLMFSINHEKVQLLQRAAKIRFRVKISTTEADQQRTVAVRMQDYLKAKVFLQLHPDISFSYEIGNTSNNNK